MTTSDQANAVAFFHKHAGFSYGPDETPIAGRLRNAHELAVAELTGSERGWYVETSPDENGPMDDDAGSGELVASGSHVCLDVWLMAGRDAPEGAISDVLGVLGNVIVESPDDPYVRVVGAEMARDAIAESKGHTASTARADELLAAVRTEAEAAEEYPHDAWPTLWEAFGKLDAWLSDGGTLPKGWQDAGQR